MLGLTHQWSRKVNPLTTIKLNPVNLPWYEKTVSARTGIVGFDELRTVEAKSCETIPRSFNRRLICGNSYGRIRSAVTERE